MVNTLGSSEIIIIIATAKVKDKSTVCFLRLLPWDRGTAELCASCLWTRKSWYKNVNGKTVNKKIFELCMWDFQHIQRRYTQLGRHQQVCEAGSAITRKTSASIWLPPQQPHAELWIAAAAALQHAQGSQSQAELLPCMSHFLSLCTQIHTAFSGESKFGNED